MLFTISSLFRTFSAANIVLVCLCFKSITSSIVQTQPRHVHLALGGNYRFFHLLKRHQYESKFTKFNMYLILDNMGEMVVTWSTVDATQNSIVEYGLHGQPFNQNRASGTMKILVEDKVTNSSLGINEQFIHRVVLRNLTSNTFYRKVTCYATVSYSS